MNIYTALEDTRKIFSTPADAELGAGSPIETPLHEAQRDADRMSQLLKYLNSRDSSDALQAIDENDWDFEVFLSTLAEYSRVMNSHDTLDATIAAFEGQ